MRLSRFAILAFALLTLAACGTDNSVQGNSSNGRTNGQVKMGVPF